MRFLRRFSVCVTSTLVVSASFITLTSKPAQACFRPRPTPPPPPFRPVIIIPIPIPFPGFVLVGNVAEPFEDPITEPTTCTAGAGFGQDPNVTEVQFGIVDIEGNFEEFRDDMGNLVFDLERPENPDPLDMMFADNRPDPNSIVDEWYGFQGTVTEFDTADFPLEDDEQYAVFFKVEQSSIGNVTFQPAYGKDFDDSVHPVEYGSEQKIPEPTSTVPLLALGTLGGLLTLKRKQKQN